MYDIHSANVVPVAEFKTKIAAIVAVLPEIKHIFVNPDCGLKVSLLLFCLGLEMCN